MPHPNDMSPETLRNLTDWLNQPLTPGKQKELTEWLAADPDNQLKWERWLEFNTTAKQLQIVPTEALAQWGILRDDLGFGRSSNKRTKRRSKKSKRSILKTPIFVAILSMLVFSAFLMILHFIRSGSAF